MHVLGGDVGGTKVHLGLFEDAALHEDHRFTSTDHRDFESLCAEFLKGRDVKLSAAVFGIAGPVIGGRVEATNLPWVIERQRMERLLGCPVILMNDLEATAHGIPELDPGEIRVLNEGEEIPGASRAIIAAGTGLGEGYMTFEASTQRYAPRASEGGHADYAARNAEEIEMLRFLLDRFGHVSVERVVSGTGLKNIFDYLESTGRHDVPPPLREALAAQDPAAVISQSAQEGHPDICVEAMRRFIAAYGAETGNLALKVMALGGVYIGGGIAPKILPMMEDGLFMGNFLDKGRFAPLVERMPVRIILDDAAALLGAGAVAMRRAAGIA